MTNIKPSWYSNILPTKVVVDADTMRCSFDALWYEVDEVLRVDPKRRVEIHASIEYYPPSARHNGLYQVMQDELVDDFVQGLDVSQIVLVYDPRMFG
jgi:hypothetical protein